MHRYNQNLFLASLTSIEDNKEVGKREGVAKVIELATTIKYMTEDALRNLNITDIREALELVHSYDDYSIDEDRKPGLIQEMIHIQIAKDNLELIKPKQTSSSVDFF